MAGINFMNRSACGCDGNFEDEVMQENSELGACNRTGDQRRGKLEVQFKTPPRCWTATDKALPKKKKTKKKTAAGGSDKVVVGILRPVTVTTAHDNKYPAWSMETRK